jgi:hypothetical protein
MLNAAVVPEINIRQMAAVRARKQVDERGLSGQNENNGDRSGLRHR